MLDAADLKVAAEVRAEMARRQLTAKQLAKETGLDLGFLYRRLSGDVAFRAAELLQIAHHLGIPPTQFLDVASTGRSA